MPTTLNTSYNPNIEMLLRTNRSNVLVPHLFSSFRIEDDKLESIEDAIALYNRLAPNPIRINPNEGGNLLGNFPWYIAYKRAIDIRSIISTFVTLLVKPLASDCPNKYIGKYCNTGKQ